MKPNKPKQTHRSRQVR